MKARLFGGALLALLALAPLRAAHAIPVIVVGGNGTIQETISAAANPVTANSTLLSQVKGYVLDPIAHALAQLVLQQITASVVNWINGTGSGGSPLFVTNLSLYLRSVADNQALSFIAEIGTQSNSPFAAVIASSLRTNYLQSSSAAGFWSANQCTLYAVSPNINSYLAGNFSQGGWGAWFSLTTQPQNNPYSLYYRSQAELAARVAGAQGQASTQLGYSNGFFSWCGGATGGGGGANAGAACSTDDDCAGALACLSGKCAVDPSLGNPPNSCTKSDGSTGTIQTPGSVIYSSLSKVTGSGIDSLVNVQDFNQMVSAIMSALITKVLSSLTGVSASGYATQLQNANPLAATSTSSGTQGESILQTVNADVASRQSDLAAYAASWQSILGAAQAASSSVMQLVACEQANGVGDGAFGALEAGPSEIAPVYAQAAQASSTVGYAQTMVRQVQADASSTASGDLGASGALTSDLQTLLAMPPSAADAANAQSEASATGGATSSTGVSLLVSGGTTIDQMQLISANAANALLLCETPALP
ncbi:MAG TPA: hypothetical protein VHC68_03495 [Candidatus Paceibacterota bacterium]|nr:hypothetical protein [Candidatus Paceibacterota bacterium]